MPASAVPRVAAVAKAMRILGAFGPHVAELSVRQIAERAGVPRSTAHAMCATLCDAGMLEPLAGGRYQLGPALVEMGGQVIARTGLVAAAEATLPALARATGGEAHLGQLVGGWVVYVGRVPIGVSIPMRNKIGLRAAAHLSGCGKAALAHAPIDQLQPLVVSVCQAEGRPLPDFSRLGAELEDCRRKGYVVSASFQDGRASVAAPVFDGAGVAIGGVSVAGLASMFNGSLVEGVADRVMSAAATMSERLGYEATAEVSGGRP